MSIVFAALPLLRGGGIAGGFVFRRGEDIPVHLLLQVRVGRSAGGCKEGGKEPEACGNQW